MGGIVGGVIGGVGSLFGGQSAKSNDLTGYNYLSGQRGNIGPGVVSYNTAGVGANTAEANLLGLNGAAGTTQANQALGNYLNSSGFQFAQNQGSRSISGNQAAKGLLNSGSTAKALSTFGTELAQQGYGNYLNSLAGVAGQGLTAAGQIGQAGTQGGAQAGNAMQSGITGLFGSVGGGIANSGFGGFGSAPGAAETSLDQGYGMGSNYLNPYQITAPTITPNLGF